MFLAHACVRSIQLALNFFVIVNSTLARAAASMSAAAGDPNYNIVPALPEQILYSLEASDHDVLVTAHHLDFILQLSI